MKYVQRKILLKDGISALLREPTAEDAPRMLDYLRICAGETEFLLRTSEDPLPSLEQEVQFLENIAADPNSVMILCEVNGELAGNCQLSRSNRIKTRHRARIAIGLKRKFWNLGIGTQMLAELISIARDLGVLQLELEVIEGNERAKHLYEKMGFTVVSEHPDAIQFRNGTFGKELLMIQKL